MFGNIVNFLSPTAFSGDSSVSQAVAAATNPKMARRTWSSLASASIVADPAANNHHTHGTSEDAMAVNFSGPLLTPENSRSETSSNNENASGEEKPTLQRTPIRMTRASLRGMETLDEVDKDSELSADLKAQDPSDDMLVKRQIGDENAPCPSVLRHSIAVMETSWSQATPGRDNAVNEEPTPQCDTPVSKGSLESTDPSLPSRRVGSTKAAFKELPISQKATESDQIMLRRSTRLGLLGKTAEILEKATSVLGKRSRDIMEKGKELSRRASLRPRNIISSKEGKPMSTSLQLPAAKKRRVSESDLASKSSVKGPSSEEESPATAALVQRHKPKRWLSHGLYIGQDRYMDPRLNEAKNKLKSAIRSLPREPQRQILPMPMFAGERLLKNGRDFRLPFDVFSPLPPGQPKPDEWRKTNKNVFVGEAASIWKANKPIELSTCTCSKDTGCDENCQNRYMFYECDDTNCKLGQNCGNRNFDELKQRTKAGGKYNIGVEVIKTADRGYGVRSNRTFDPNQIIVEYTGEIITQSECESRMKTIYKNNECYYLMYFDQNMIIDATRGSIARFVNHSCEPNCRMEKWTVSGKPRMALFAGDRGIMTGEELTYDYNFDPFSQKNVQECRCGAPTCRGVLGPRPKDQRPKESKDDNKKSRSQAKKGANSSPAGKKRKAERVLDESTSRLNKKRKLLAAKPLTAGFKKAMSKARTSISKRHTVISTQKMKAAKSIKPIKLTKPAKTTKAKAKTTTIKLLKSKIRPKIKPKVPKGIKVSMKQITKRSGRVSGPRSKTKSSSEPVPKTKSSAGSSKLNRPSEKLKAQISASARRPTNPGRVRKARTTNKNKEVAKASKSRQASAADKRRQARDKVSRTASGRRVSGTKPATRMGKGARNTQKRTIRT